LQLFPITVQGAETGIRAFDGAFGGGPDQDLPQILLRISGRMKQRAYKAKHERIDAEWTPLPNLGETKKYRL
jgi:hypothetical protein